MMDNTLSAVSTRSAALSVDSIRNPFRSQSDPGTWIDSTPADAY